MSVECAVTVKCGQETVSITAPYNKSLFALLLRRGFLQHRDTACGGCGLCGKCTVKAAGRLSKMNAEERSMLGDELVSKGYRLACCCYIKGDCTITVPDKREASQKNAESVQRGYGISMDIGDFVVTASLQDLSKNIQLDIISQANAQADMGDAENRVRIWTEGGAAKLRALLTSQLDSITDELMFKNGVTAISRICAVGSTCMLHMLAGVDISGLPQNPLTCDNLALSGREASLAKAPEAAVELCGAISGSIGSDTVAAALVTGMYKSLMPVLLINFGAEVNILMGNSSVLLACSVPMGDIFEGRNITCGVPVRPGAIYKLWKEKYKVCYRTVDGKAPIGLCGCALFEALELMLDVGIIDASGRMLRPEELRPSKLRMLGTVKGEQVFFIDRKHKIYITQEDVYRIQHAKAAVLAAVRCMFEQFDITEPADMSAVYLGGIFGGMISPKTAVNTGLLPALCEKICYGIGNAAIEGATIMLRSARARATAEHVRTYARLFNAENTADYSRILKESERFARPE